LKKIILPASLFFIIVLAGIYFDNSPQEKEESRKASQHFNGPAEFAEFHRIIRTREGEDKPGYSKGYRFRELQIAKTKNRFAARTQSNGVLEWTERGPANVPGRTRGLVVDPDDASKNTWFAGSVGGGVWKTTDAGQAWTLITPDLANLATSVVTMAESNHDVMYVGTGEGFFNVDGISGSGIFKSTDRGLTWDHLTSTIAFGDVNRLSIDPADANIVVAATSTGIFRTINGGVDWLEVLSEDFIQDLKSTPGNFQIQYASSNGLGIYKSINGGQDWSLTASSSLLSNAARIEMAISPVNTNRIFAGADIGFGENSILFTSADAGSTWSQVSININNNEVDFGNGQGWYDNTVACDPFNENVVYFGGVDLFRLELGTGSTVVELYLLEEDNTQNFLSLVDFTSASHGNFDIGAPNEISVEIRFGSGISQQAHRFLVPAGQSSGVPVTDFSYQDYVTVDFEVWDITNNRQLMASFRDQGRDGTFNLIENNTTATDVLLQSREYLYVHNIDYDPSNPSTLVNVNGGQEVNMMYYIWPTLSPGGTWPPATNGTLRFTFTSQEKLNATTAFITDGRNQYGDPDKNSIVHVDHHNITMIPVTGTTFKILNANDGGVFVSNTASSPGINNGDWTFAGTSYNTSQFYGADKRPEFNEYLGGMQDNGTWKSPTGTNPSATTNYLFNLGGDGFEVIWNNLNDQLLIGGSQGNIFSRSTNGGTSWVAATSGLTGEHPFISKLANSKAMPDRIFTLGSKGVFVSQNFGANWTLTPITEKWGAATSTMDVEVSRANANIVWAGSGMSTTQNLHVSINGGESFTMTNNFPDVNLGSISKLASHPFEENTAYALFSIADAPKILKTSDLGQTWEDISGFGTTDESSTGFPDVAAYCLYVRPDNPDIIWVGTEIGIVESLDNGQTWTLIDDFPNVSVWDMKGQDDQVVIATHGRGIWTATIDAPQISVAIPEIIASGTSPKKELVLKIKVEQYFDKIEFYEGTTLLGALNDIDSSEVVVTVSGVSSGTKNIRLVAFKGTAPFHSKTYSIEQLDILSIESVYSTYFDTTTDLTLTGFALQTTPGALTGERKTLQTEHNYPDNADQTVILLHPVIVSASFPTLFYSDIAIVEPGDAGSVFGTPEFKDYVVVEASKNGLDWTALESGYNASANQVWLDAFNASAPGSKEMFVDHELNLDNTFNAGDTVLIRYRLSANQTVNGWGAAIGYIAIQQEPTAVENPLLAREKVNLFPNPTNGNFTVEFELADPTEVRAEVVDLFGRRVLSRDLGQKGIGTHQEAFDLSNAAQGSYLVILKTNKGNKAGRISVGR